MSVETYAKMKKLVLIISLIFLFIVGVFNFTTNASACEYDKLSYTHQNSSVQQILNTINDGTIQAYNLTEEHHLLTKNESDNNINLSNQPNESQLDFNKIVCMDALNFVKISSHSNYIVNSKWVFLSHTTPRAP